MESIITNILGPIVLVLFLLLILGHMAGASAGDVIGPFTKILGQVITLTINAIVTITTELIKLIPLLVKAILDTAGTVIKQIVSALPKRDATSTTNITTATNSTSNDEEDPPIIITFKERR